MDGWMRIPCIKQYNQLSAYLHSYDNLDKKEEA